MAVISNCLQGNPPPVSKSKYDILHQRVPKLHESHSKGLITTTQLHEQARHVVSTYYVTYFYLLL